MKVRAITVAGILLLAIPAVYFGGWFTYAFGFVFVGIGIYELVAVRDDKVWPWYFRLAVWLFSFIMMNWPVLSNLVNNGEFAIPSAYKIYVNPIFIIFYLLVLMSIEIATQRIAAVDVFYLFSMSLMLCFACQSFIAIRVDLGYTALFYLILVTYSNDTFAYLFGMKFGKHKLAPTISPKKSWEGAIAGIVMATIIGTLFYHFFPFGGEDFNIILVIIMSLVLAIGGIFGDLVFSSIKRHFKMKDFGKIFPGHGGMLDRIDSIAFNLIIYVVVYGIYTGELFI